MFENLSSRLDKAFQTLKGHSKLTELNIAETVKEIRRALVDADVSFKIAKDFTNTVKEKAIGANVLTSVAPGQLLTKIVNDELVLLLGGESKPINLTGSPAIILIAGLQGSGKTTFSGKLASYLKSKGKNPLLVACDVYRPAAINQIKVLGEQVGVSVFANEENKNPVSIAQDAIKHAKANQHNVVIIDTAGRLSIDEAMMTEISNLKLELKPQEILFVVDAMTGQDAVNTAKAFNDKLDFDGVVLTKMDGDTRGGAAISIKSIVNKPIKFVSTGEKLDALDVFYPDRMASRILGMGDIVSFVERAQNTFDAEEAAKLQKKMRKNQFDFEDFLKQLNQIKKMGNIKDLMAMIPGVGKAIKDIDIDDDSFKGIEAIIQSMTTYERQNPETLDGSRKTRIAKGSGTSVTEVNKLIKQFDEMRKMMKMMNNNGGGRPAKMPFRR
ncbi:MAG TPA: signal recognition particle protein [Bacteroidetes bacterium]|jgi:signal recognition particle subunit SRP54|nr:signal recognition particle protein [Bacteroidota bacterium]|tara:strand:- start:3283 stop:4605 length:1323 start_codon:yes stop_codon:yes gene_type:complete